MHDLFGHFCEAVAERVDYEFEAVGHFKLGKDGAQVVSHCSFADEQSLADLLVLEPLADQRNHLALSIGKSFDLRNFRIG